MTLPVEVTGLGCICAAGRGVDRVHEALYNQDCEPVSPTTITADLKADYPVFEIPAGEIDEPELSCTNAFSLTALREALQQSGLSAEQLERARVGVCIGTTVGCTLNNEPFYRQFRRGDLPGIESIQRYRAGNPALLIAERYKLRGPVATVVNACSAGADAIGLAKSWLEEDYCDIAIAGGADELSRITYLGFASLMVMSPVGCRPFCATRTGLNLGEGAGLMVLEQSGRAQGRGIKPLATLVGYGTAADAYHPTAPHPEGTGLSRAIAVALQQAGITCTDIDFINSHGTATIDNDRVEGKVIHRLFPADLPVVSTKACTGHTLGAAGGLEAVFTVQALRDQLLPSTRRFSERDPECLITPTIEQVRLEAEYGMSDSLAFGGNNTALLFRRWSV